MAQFENEVNQSATQPVPGKYRSYQSVFETSLPDRTWPDKVITSAPEWCSVDLRDGNQALPNPMSVEKKTEFFSLLAKMGFRQIEIGFPSASGPDHDFTRLLIEERKIPGTVIPQVLVAARADLIDKTFDSLRGGSSAIVHVYNSTSALQREVVFRMTKDQILSMAVDATKRVRELANRADFDVRYQYSPESFTGTERAFALDVCNAVIDEWGPTPDQKMIINLPATVEMSTPNVYADLMEWMSRHLHRRDSVILSVHTHNDRGGAEAATELGLLAGAQRVESTLFGNGERGGNADTVILALNMFSQGIDPRLDFSDLPKIQAVYERCTGMSVPERHPYAGDLATVAFSGTHQNAIRRGLTEYKRSGGPEYRIPYIPLDFGDVGRSVQLIEVNQQSGKNAVAYVMESKLGCTLPKKMEAEFGRVVQRWCDANPGPMPRDVMWKLFEGEFVKAAGPIALQHFTSTSVDDGKTVQARFELLIYGKSVVAEGQGNGTVDAAAHAFRSIDLDVDIVSLDDHALRKGSDAAAIAYVCVQRGKASCFGVGINENIENANIEGFISAVNRLLVAEQKPRVDTAAAAAMGS